MSFRIQTNTILEVISYWVVSLKVMLIVAFGSGIRAAFLNPVMIFYNLALKLVHRSKNNFINRLKTNENYKQCN